MEYIILFISIAITILSYFMTRNKSGSILFDRFPDRFLIKNKKILKYLFNPKNKVPIWFFIFHILQVIGLFAIITLYILLWTKILPVSMFKSKWFYLSYVLYNLVIIAPISFIHGNMLSKYAKK